MWNGRHHAVDSSRQQFTKSVRDFIKYTVAGTATAGSDYTSLSDTVAVQVGEASVTIPIATTDDSADENDETVILTLAAGPGYIVGGAKTRTLTITDDDAVQGAVDGVGLPPGLTKGSFNDAPDRLLVILKDAKAA